ncbi:MAG: nickel-dependent lactate racemase [Desulfobacteraceae bacterium]|nr:nickel-dependent lactate racemase [Desulfobacteraceae bacterium]
MYCDYPRMYRIRQRFDNFTIADVSAAVREEFARVDLSRRVRPGQRVAVAVGSRGIDRLPAMVATTVECLREMGLEPFVVPAMGSHGGATDEGQAEVLRHMGISQETVHAPVVSHMEVVSLGRLDNGADVFVSRDIAETDHVVVINRVKPHTAFRSDVESGLCKMLAVGCGKHLGALSMHKFDLGESIQPAARMILERTPVLCGLAILENSLDRTHAVRMALPDEFVDVDRSLLQRARTLLPRIPVEALDILIVNEMGKDISGGGIDPNVVGFWRRYGGPRTPDYRTVIVLDITEKSDGNAVGIGMADLTTERVRSRIDLEKTYTNALTTGIWASVRLPIVLRDDRAALDAGLAHVTDLRKVRMARILNSLSLETLWVSEQVVKELTGRAGIEIDDSPIAIAFDSEGRLLPFEIPEP